MLPNNQKGEQNEKEAFPTTKFSDNPNIYFPLKKLLDSKEAAVSQPKKFKDGNILEVKENR